MTINLARFPCLTHAWIGYARLVDTCLGGVKTDGGFVRARAAEWGWSTLLVLTFSAYYIVPSLPASIVLLMLCFAICYIRLALAVSLVPLAMPFFMLPKHLGHPHPQFALGETAIVLCILAFFAHLLYDILRGQAAKVSAMVRQLAPSSLLGYVVPLFLFAATVATVAAHSRHEALEGYRWTIVEPIIYYSLVVCLLREVRSMVRALWALAGSGIIVASLGIGQYLFTPRLLTGATWVKGVRVPLHQPSSVYGSPDNLALLLDRALPVAVVLGLAAFTANPTRKPRMYAAWLGVAIMVIADVLSGSRGGMITAAAAIVFVVLLWRGHPFDRANRPLLLGGAIAVVIGTIAVLIQVQHGLSTSMRPLVWGSALRMIRDHPFLGVGPDNFLAYYFDPHIAIDPAHPKTTNCLPANVHLAARYYMSPLAANEPCLSHPHTVILDVWLSTGFLGFVAFVALILALSRAALVAVRHYRNGGMRVVSIASIIIVVATVVHGLVDNSIFVPDLAVAFWLALALFTNANTTTSRPIPRI